MHRFSVLAGLICTLILPAAAIAQNSDTIDFENLPAGTMVTMLFGMNGTGPILVEGINPMLANDNAALIFDTEQPTGEDFDLGTPNQGYGGPGVGAAGAPGQLFQNDTVMGNVLIVAEDLVDAGGDGLVDDPDDVSILGSMLAFDFHIVGTVTMVSMNLIDIEFTETPAVVEMYDPLGNLLDMRTLPNVGDNGVALVDLGGVSGVARLVVTLNASGAVDNLVFENDDVDPYCFAALTDCPCGNDDLGAGCSNSTGSGASLFAFGSSSVTSDDLLLVATGIPSGEMALFFMALDQVRVPFGDGLRCVGGGPNKILRMPPPVMSAGGMATYGPGIVQTSCTTLPAAGCISAGQTWNFQVWYGDPNGPCSSGASFTNALAIDFL